MRSTTTALATTIFFLFSYTCGTYLSLMSSGDAITMLLILIGFGTYLMARILYDLLKKGEGNMFDGLKALFKYIYDILRKIFK